MGQPDIDMTRPATVLEGDAVAPTAAQSGPVALDVLGAQDLLEPARQLLGVRTLRRDQERAENLPVQAPQDRFGVFSNCTCPTCPSCSAP